MLSEVENWNDAVNDAYTYLKERDRTYDLKKMLAVVDMIATAGEVSQTLLLQGAKKPNFVATVLSLVTMAVHKKGAVPHQPFGWYSTSGTPPTYKANPLFAAAWRNKRRI
jgi:hypothetical protein